MNEMAYGSLSSTQTLIFIYHFTGVWFGWCVFCGVLSNQPAHSTDMIIVKQQCPPIVAAN